MRLEPYVDRLLLGFGALLAVFMAAESVWVVVSGQYGFANGAYVVGILTSLPSLACFLAGGIYLSRSSFSPGQKLRVLKWTAGFGVGFLVVNVALMFTIPPGSVHVAVGWARWAISTGVGAGFLIGYYEARAVQRAVVAERASLQAEQAEDRREMLEYLNSLLRHEVLNTAAVISGYADMLKEQTDADDPAYERLEVIGRQATELTATTRDVRVLLQSMEEGSTLAPVDVSDLL